MVDTRTQFVMVALVIGTIAGLGVGMFPQENTDQTPAVDNATQNAAQTEGTPAQTGATDTPGQASVSLVGSGLPGEVVTDRELVVSVTLATDADTSQTRDVRVYVDRDEDGEPEKALTTRRVRIPSTGTTEVDLAVSGGKLDPGTNRFGVGIGDRMEPLGTTTVLQSTTLVVQDAETNLSAVRNHTTTITATVRNQGDVEEKRPVRLQIDEDGDGIYTRAETHAETNLSVAPGRSRDIRLQFTAPSFAPGTYPVRLTTPSGSVAGELALLEPATPTLQTTNATVNVTRGTNATVTVRVHNAGDVQGNETVQLRGPDGYNRSVDVTLEGGEGKPVQFTIPTADTPRGNYTYAMQVGKTATEMTVRVREPHFQVSKLRGNETLYVGDPMIFAANVTNTGDAAGTTTVSYRIDLNDDNQPEDDNITKQITLEPGEERVVRFNIPYLEDPDPLNQVEDLPYGTYIYGIYTPDSNRTTVFEARPSPDYATAPGGSGGSGGGGGGNDTGTGPVTLDEIAQEKYEHYYRQLSPETQLQLNEVELRQPFAGNLGITDVMTREELARWRFGADVPPGEDFQFTELDIETQQKVEAAFDAQFTKETGDRIESWDELAQAQYGMAFDALNQSQQAQIKQAYQDQFDS